MRSLGRDGADRDKPERILDVAKSAIDETFVSVPLLGDTERRSALAMLRKATSNLNSHLGSYNGFTAVNPSCLLDPDIAIDQKKVAIAHRRLTRTMKGTPSDRTLIEHENSLALALAWSAEEPFPHPQGPQGYIKLRALVENAFRQTDTGTRQQYLNAEAMTSLLSAAIPILAWYERLGTNRFEERDLMVFYHQISGETLEQVWEHPKKFYLACAGLVAGGILEHSYGKDYQYPLQLTLRAMGLVESRTAQ